MFIHFERIHERDGQCRRTYRRTPNDGIGRACIASRGKNRKSGKENRRNLAYIFWKIFDFLGFSGADSGQMQPICGKPVLPIPCDGKLWDGAANMWTSLQMQNRGSLWGGAVLDQIWCSVTRLNVRANVEVIYAEIHKRNLSIGNSSIWIRSRELRVYPYPRVKPTRPKPDPTRYPWVGSGRVVIVTRRVG